MAELSRMRLSSLWEKLVVHSSYCCCLVQRLIYHGVFSSQKDSHCWNPLIFRMVVCSSTHLIYSYLLWNFSMYISSILIYGIILPFFFNLYEYLFFWWSNKPWNIGNLLSDSLPVDLSGKNLRDNGEWKWWLLWSLSWRFSHVVSNRVFRSN